MHIMNANVQKKNNHIEAKDKFKSRDTTRDFAAGAAPHVFTDVIAELRGELFWSTTVLIASCRKSRIVSMPLLYTLSLN